MTGTLDAQVLKAAATWYVQLTACPPSAHQQQAWQAWLAQSSAHAQAWARVEKLQQQLGSLPTDVALPTLVGVRARRRAVLKTLVLLLAAGGTGWGTLELEPVQARMAQHRTATGQRKHWQLADGSQLDLNTDSAVDVHYNDSVRALHLIRGEILIQTAADSLGRPFIVHTPQGSVRALGTRFSVRSEAGSTEVHVMEHAVELRPLADTSRVLRLESGQQAHFDRQRVSAPSALPAGADAWTRGMLMVVDGRLADVLDEIGRYRTGILHYSPAVANVRVSGAFRLDDSDTLLQNLSRSLPIRVRYLTRYWVRVEAV
ncbi:FecR domain-containing protein [Pseudomonas sp. 7P_10.2_Bac1]|uniref:FecR domain-containing protein n=1 Tax=Pseudomonas sp. 7P_10.2_Bac1 TaxID=2971614 RepID=UPI0021C66C1E|nr:FecR domain-containing protein [Pseudomonas sp. 7P_10.2_Bac1]MCU1728137.1 FecR domain-containing protein [Pseudomonas sp. 7P_10.2_Bac1]